MGRQYDPTDWYWQVGDDESQVWSSAAAGLRPASDPAYLAFLADDGIPSRAIALEDLRETLIAAGCPSCGPRNTEDLLAELAAERYRRQATTTIDGVVYDTSDTAGARLLASINAREMAVAIGAEQPGATRGWKVGPGVTVQLTLDAQKTLFMKGVLHVQACFDHETALAAQLLAGQTVDFSAGWPE